MFYNKCKNILFIYYLFIHISEEKWLNIDILKSNMCIFYSFIQFILNIYNFAALDKLYKNISTK